MELGNVFIFNYIKPRNTANQSQYKIYICILIVCTLYEVFFTNFINGNKVYILYSSKVLFAIDSHSCKGNFKSKD